MTYNLGKVFEKCFCKGNGKRIVVTLKCDNLIISTKRWGKKKELQIRWSTWKSSFWVTTPQKCQPFGCSVWWVFPIKNVSGVLFYDSCLYHTIFATIISNSQTRAKKKEDDGSFFCKISRDITKKNCEKRFRKKRSLADAKCT